MKNTLFNIFIIVVGSLFVSDVWAVQDPKAIGGVASNIISNMEELAKLITSGTYIAGMGFGVSAILKFKAHKDNPTQIPIGTPIALCFIAAALLYMPSIFTTMGETIFGSSAMPGGYSGMATFGDEFSG